MKIDELKQKWKNGEVTLGASLSGPDPFLAQSMALGGCEMLWIDGEHGAITMENAQRNIAIAQKYGLAALFRVRWNDPVIVKPVLDMDPDAIVFPMIKSREEAEKAVAACQYPLRGVRSYWPGQPSNRGLLTGREYFDKADKVFKIMQIEHYQAVENLEEILKVDGVDSIVVGMSDLSASVGKLLELRDPEVLGLMDKIGEIALRSGKPFGVSSGYNPVIFEEWLQRGAQWFTFGDEYNLVLQASQNLIGAARGQVEKFQKK